MSGSRALDPRYAENPGTRESEVRATNLAWTFLHSLSARHACILVVGDCEYGLDAWAHMIASVRQMNRMVYCVDGWVRGVKDGVSIEARWATKSLTARNPLNRDMAMARSCKQAAERGDVVYFAGYQARWSRSGGTIYTLKAFEEHVPSMNLRTYLWRIARDGTATGGAIRR